MKLRDYRPWYYRGVVESEALMDAEQPEFDSAKARADADWDDRFVISAGARGVRRYEKIVEVHADERGETMEFRRGRIVNRLTTMPPFPMRFLRKKLDQIVGEGLWGLGMDYGNYALTIRVHRTDRDWRGELLATLRAILPANIGHELWIILKYAPEGTLYLGCALPVRVSFTALPSGQIGG